MGAPLPRTRAALAALDAGRGSRAALADTFAAETAAYNRDDTAHELVASDAGLAWLRETFGAERIALPEGRTALRITPRGGGR